ncbi:DUF4157 domain-containing protein [Dendronalium sp. ChiSLP03b]|uniref:eCIS core domain-containing protein n=1 Tax=Dendronalium sp. ChiSLP03b TaxID=3075381 RepID=UPI002AD40902|nr:DUF4157 domain-containing protein [Dendronalium sp. ChiSLP03b]MDZ8203798.1 DUF4157 domain-containing protein [Dendronalium sp. ChiSLP03b]
MLAFQFKRSHKAPASQENHEPFFKKPGSRDSHFFSSTKENSVQTKLTVGKTGDAFEQEADAVANAVVNHSDSDVWRQDASLRDASRTRLRNSQNPASNAIAQRQEDTANSRIQRQEEPKKEEVQTKPELQLMEEPKQEEVQTKPDVQLQEEPKEEVQTKPEAGTQTANPSLSSRLQSSKGRGHPLPAKTQIEMASAFGTDFSDVHIHTNQESVQMNRELKAQAFTQGKDIYFNQGKFDPESVTGKHLLAHELTHVVQQNKNL